MTMIPLPHEWEESVAGCMDSLLKLEERFKTFLITKDEETTDKEWELKKFLVSKISMF